MDITGASGSEPGRSSQPTFRLGEDWAAETSKQIGRASLTIVGSDKTRNVAHVSVDRGTNVTNTHDMRVDRALRGKVNQTNRLIGVLESNIDNTNLELQKMHATRKYITQEKEKSMKHATVNIERRDQRMQRPAREQVHDNPHRELRKQGDLFQETQNRYVRRLNEVDRCIHQLRNVRENLVNDLNDKAKGIELDKQCIGMCATDTTNTYSPNVQLVQDQQTGMPFEWRKGTLLTADEAVMNHRQAQKVRKACFHTSHRRKLMEQHQHDVLQRTLLTRVDSIAKLRESLQVQLAHVQEEIAKAHKVKRKLDDAIAEKMAPLNLAKQRYDTRSKKPQREVILDEVEHALSLQYSELKVCVSELQAKVCAVNEHIASLEKTKVELKLNIQDKSRNILMDQQIHSMAPSRPPTGATINTGALSLRPVTGSTTSSSMSQRKTLSAFDVATTRSM
mmetsp:Transcript_29385/g.56414  ORF Transcript_29385/g.56414 Transcript_29385/m.56414 type:complete len:450 (+) Transcript_29385:217-1566(+)|eukprot:CAMPEP_0114253916 /NCGR_PEP_ID=MMETSP0058-20121206/16680_1 /TAXON_ID=36894 /ORGANISM="Pyramimonas parkeae, CCMP726" /LENGTH=449 /DNA_ID=CAMNT_0001368059 /DNA_START=190 /DNA_END=1539 /DNA_ORIENTATION=-